MRYLFIIVEGVAISVNMAEEVTMVPSKMAVLIMRHLMGHLLRVMASMDVVVEEVIMVHLKVVAMIMMHLLMVKVLAVISMDVVISVGVEEEAIMVHNIMIHNETGTTTMSLIAVEAVLMRGEAVVVVVHGRCDGASGDA